MSVSGKYPPGRSLANEIIYYSLPALASGCPANLQPPGHERRRSFEAEDAVPGRGSLLPAPREPG